MKINQFFSATTLALASGVLLSPAQAHPGHGETGWLHNHSAIVIAATVVGIVIAALVVQATVVGKKGLMQTMWRRVRSNDGADISRKF